ncbi:MAG: hypothetical protein AABW79_03180 [Nanoarchaeota archaeon]
MTQIGTAESRAPIQRDISSLIDLFREVSGKYLRFTDVTNNRVGNNMNFLIIKDEVVGDRHFLEFYAEDISGEDYQAQAQMRDIDRRHSGYNTKVYHSEERGFTFVEVFKGQGVNI